MLRLGYNSVVSLVWINLYPCTTVITCTGGLSLPNNIRQYIVDHRRELFIYPLCKPHLNQIRSYSRLLQSADKRVDRRKSALKKQVILIDHNGTNLGSMTREVAMQLAEAQGMELVDVVKKTKGEQDHVCRMMTKKDIWERNKKKKEVEKNSRLNVTKEIKMATVISDHDISTKVHQMQKMMEKRHKVKLIIEPRLRRYQWEIDELREAEQAKQQELVSSITERISEFGSPLNEEKWHGRNLVITFKPR